MEGEEDSVPQPPVVNIPGGTRWIKITAPHPAQIVKVKKTTAIAVFYVQEKPGQSQGKVGGTHRSDRQGFLRDYEPYTKRDWDAARHVMAQVERQKAEEVEGEATEPTSNGTVTITSDQRADTQADLDAWGVPGTLEHVELPEEEVASPQEGEMPREEQEARIIPAPRRMKFAEIPDTEQEEIVELWRTGEPVTDIASTYNAPPGVIYNVVSTRVPDEYRLQRVVEQLKRNPGPIPAYVVSQWWHLDKAKVEEICTSDDAVAAGIRYSVEVRDPKKPWIKTPMVELAPTATPDESPIAESTTPESEIAVATPAKSPNAPTEAPVQFVITDSTAPAITNNNTNSSDATPLPPGSKFFTVKVRMTEVQDRVLASDIQSALDAAKDKYAGRGTVVAVMEE